MFFKSNGFKLCIGLLLGVIVLILPRPEGTQFKISGDVDKNLYAAVDSHYQLISEKFQQDDAYILEAKTPGTPEATAKSLKAQAENIGVDNITVDHVDGLSPKAKRFLAILVVLYSQLSRRQPKMLLLLIHQIC